MGGISDKWYNGTGSTEQLRKRQSLNSGQSANQMERSENQLPVYKNHRVFRESYIPPWLLTAYFIPKSFWICSKVLPFVSGITFHIKTNAITIIAQ